MKQHLNKKSNLGRKKLDEILEGWRNAQSLLGRGTIANDDKFVL